MLLSFDELLYYDHFYEQVVISLGKLKTEYAEGEHQLVKRLGIILPTWDLMGFLIRPLLVAGTINHAGTERPLNEDDMELRG